MVPRVCGENLIDKCRVSSCRLLQEVIVNEIGYRKCFVAQVRSNTLNRPSVGSETRAQSRRAACGAQEHSMGLALAMYTLEMRYYPGDHLHREPGQLGFSSSMVTWMPRLVRYMGEEHKTFWCPDAPEDTRAQALAA